jgi:hypothetical protein
MATTINESGLIEIGWRLIPKASICLVEQYDINGEQGITVHVIGGHRVVVEGWTLEDFRVLYDGAPF